MDPQEFADIEAYGEERWLGELADKLRRKRYRAEAVRRVWIPESRGEDAPARHSLHSRSDGDDGSGGGAGTDLRSAR